MAEKIVITGATGLLGANFIYTALQEGWSPVGVAWPCRLPAAPVPMFELDLRKVSDAADFLAQQRPAWLVHLAAMTNVDWCEEHAVETRQLNAEVSGALAAAAAQVGAGFVYMSTDSVFDGCRGGYGEDDEPNPLNVYAASKLEGEHLVLQANPAALVVRSNIFGWNAQPKANLAEWLVKNLRAGKTIPGFTDVIFAPLLVTTLADWILNLMRAGARGRWHVASRSPISKYDFARAVALAFDLPESMIQPVKAASVAQRAHRPLNTWLKADSAAQKLGRELPDLTTMLRDFRAQEDSGYAQRLRATLGGVAI
jgi:dTDP-4-dehydrorhamnose reductase